MPLAVAGANEGLRGKIAGEVVSKAPCARLAKEWTQRKLSTLAWARSHATDNALQGSSWQMEGGGAGPVLHVCASGRDGGSGHNDVAAAVVTASSATLVRAS